MAGVLGGLAALLLLAHRPAGPWLLAAAGLFAGAGVVAPRALDPVERAWMLLGRWLSVATTYLVLTLAFALVVTPLGVVRRMLGGDPLRLRGGRRAASYWVPVDRDGPGSRYDRPY